MLDRYSNLRVFRALLRQIILSGLQIKEYLGNFHSQSTTEIDLGSCDADKTFSAVLEHNGKLNPRENAHLQCAVLYTTTDGRRRVRLCNLAVQIVELAGNVFRYADLDAVVSHFARKGKSPRNLCSKWKKR